MPATHESEVEEIRLIIAALPAPDVQAITLIAEALRELIRRSGPHAIMAIALVGAEESAKK